MITTHLVEEGPRRAVLDWVVREAKNETDQLGFIPRAGVERHAKLERLIVARWNSDLAGFVLFGGKWDHNRIFQLYVEPKLRRRGIGTALVERVRLWGARRGVPTTVARVRDDLPAVSFWESIGWQPTEIARGGARRGRSVVTFQSEADLTG